MTIPFKVFYPSGNITALVYKDLPKDQYSKIARAILRENHDIEQVGFVSEKNNQLNLEMMGGEFCGGAAMSCVFDSGQEKLNFQVSGFAYPILGEKNATQVSITLPENFLASIHKVVDGHRVDLHGISFLLTSADIDGKNADDLIKKYGDHKPAMGVIKFNKSAKDCSITPWVWVEETESLIKETACASGSIATAALLKSTSGEKKFFIHQPSGRKFEIEFLDPKKILLKGSVEFLGLRHIVQ